MNDDQWYGHIHEIWQDENGYRWCGNENCRAYLGSAPPAAAQRETSGDRRE